MAGTNFKTENNTFRKLMGNGLIYHIPRFQRDYSWGEDEWEDLWLDFLATLNDDNENSHYMGYLVLQSDDDKRFNIIDGQQRVTTISLIILAILKNIQKLIDTGHDPDNNKIRMNQIRQTYIGYLDPVTLISSPKLILNRKNNDYFKNYIIPLRELPQRGFIASVHSLRKAFNWYDKHVSEYLKKFPDDHGKVLAELVENMSDRLFFTVITVSNELNAYKVFETLNARGVKLSSTDLLKNYFFSVIDRGESFDSELEEIERRWEEIVNRLEDEIFPDFLRIHWNSRYKFVRKADLFKAIKSHIKNKEDMFGLLRDLENDIDTYLNLIKPEPSKWNARDIDYAKQLKLFRITQPFSLLLSAKRVLSEGDFTKLLRAIAVISIRYNVICGSNPNEQETVYNNTAVRISQDENLDLEGILTSLRGIYPNDNVFRDNFAMKIIRTKDTRNNKVVRFILCEIERHISGNDHDFASSIFNIEHILPQNAPDYWGGISHNDAEALIYRLGNMTLLSSNINRDLANSEYKEKRDVYKESNFKITQKIGNDNEEWTADRISAHQNWLANQAKAIWRIDQLS